MEGSPFQSLNISSSEFLDEVKNREQCPGCSRSRKYFCYTCFQPVPSLVGKLPTVKLPYKIDIIKHVQELDGKSTAIHAKIIASDDVRIFVYPDIPTYDPKLKVVLVCPGVNSVTLNEYMRRQHEQISSQLHTDKHVVKPSHDVHTDSVTDESCIEERTLENRESGSSVTNAEASDEVQTEQACLLSMKTNSDNITARSDETLGPDVVVYIDSTWNQIYSMLGNEELAHLQRIELQSHETKFWRHQMDKPSTYLSTIEAIYYTAVEHYELSTDPPVMYDGRYDDLLFFFTFFYNKIAVECAKTGKSLKAYNAQRRKVPRRLQR